MNDSILPVELLQRVSPLLQEPIDYKDMTILRRQLSEIEACRYELSYARAEAYQKLLKERQRMLLPKDGALTDLDRTTTQKAGTSIIESDYQFLDSLCQIIEERLTLGQTFLTTM